MKLAILTLLVLAACGGIAEQPTSGDPAPTSTGASDVTAQTFAFLEVGNTGQCLGEADAFPMPGTLALLQACFPGGAVNPTVWAQLVALPGGLVEIQLHSAPTLCLSDVNAGFTGSDRPIWDTCGNPGTTTFAGDLIAGALHNECLSPSGANALAWLQCGAGPLEHWTGVGFHASIRSYDQNGNMQPYFATYNGVSKLLFEGSGVCNGNACTPFANDQIFGSFFDTATNGVFLSTMGSFLAPPTAFVQPVQLRPKPVGLEQTSVGPMTAWYVVADPTASSRSNITSAQGTWIWPGASGNLGIGSIDPQVLITYSP